MYCIRVPQVSQDQNEAVIVMVTVTITITGESEEVVVQHGV